MPATREKLAVPTMLLLSSMFLIILSGVHSHQCHWCGPLAEQVHRSRRAPPCDEPGDHLTTCDPGYPYCAIVATSPPYVESRYCVKVYQDECYPLFCNSTRTWRMTCPCRGDLCNGANGERELDSFAVLSKLVAKTHNSRIKKRSTVSENQLTDVAQQGEDITAVGNVTTNNVEAEIIVEKSNTEISNISDVLLYMPGVDLNKDSNNLDEEVIIKNNQSTSTSTASIDISAENEVNPNLMQADEPMLNIPTENIVINTGIPHDKQDLTSLTTDIIVEKQTTPKIHITTESNISVVKLTKATSDIEGGKRRENETKEKLPTAEALQHNENQVSKSNASESRNSNTKTVTAAETTQPYMTPNTLLTTLSTNTMNRPTNVLPKEGKSCGNINTGEVMFFILYHFVCYCSSFSFSD